MQKIFSKDISVVVQGAINKKETPKCLQSIRKYLPEAEIILSTWDGSDVSGLDYDILVLNQDPGAIQIEEFKHRKVYNNINRQLLSTKSGLKKANRKYAMKLRSDLILTSNNFLNYFDEFPKRTENYCLFERKIITSTLFTRFNIKFDKYIGRVNIPFYISDWWFFGLRQDLNTYFLDTPFIEEPVFSKYFKLEGNKNKSNPYGKIPHKFSPEQYFGYECFSRSFDDIYMEDAADYNEEIMAKSRECFVNNFIALEFKQSGIYLNKYPYSKNEKFSGTQYLGLYNFCRYENEYQKYCDNDYKITTKNIKIFEDEKYGYDLLRIYKHLFSLIDKNTKVLKKLEEFFIGLPISTVSFLIKHYKEILRG